MPRWTPQDYVNFREKEAAKHRAKAGIKIGVAAPLSTAAAMVKTMYHGELVEVGKKRIRQDSKPLMNKLESEYFNTIILSGKYWGIKAQAMRFKLANGAWYKTDITAMGYSNGHGQIIAWEIKGGKGMKGHAKSMLTLKFASTTWPEIIWILAWKENGCWQEQIVKS